MLDVFRAVVLAVGIFRAVRQRSAACMACGAALAYGWLVAALNLRTALSRGEVGGAYAMGMLFAGTPLVPVHDCGALPLGSWSAAHPVWRQVVSATIAACVWFISWRRSLPLRPESAEARRWDALGTPFLLLAVVDVVVAVAAGTMTWLADETL